MTREDFFRPSEADYDLINTLSNILTANNVPHDVHVGSSDGLQITFNWCKGDVICSWASFHILESYRFPWDEDDITRATPETMGEWILKYYKEKKGE